MAEGAQIDDLVEKISDAVFTKLSSSLDRKLKQIAKSINSVCASVPAVEKRVAEAEQRISDTEDSVSRLRDTANGGSDPAGGPEPVQTQQHKGHQSAEHRGAECKGLFRILAAKRVEAHGEERPTQAGHVPHGPHTCRTTPRAEDRRHRIHSFADKQPITKRSVAEVTFSGNRIHLFDDFSPAVGKKRREFLEAKTSLRDLGIRSQMLYPAARYR